MLGYLPKYVKVSDLKNKDFISIQVKITPCSIKRYLPVQVRSTSWYKSYFPVDEKNGLNPCTNNGHPIVQIRVFSRYKRYLPVEERINSHYR